MQDYWIGDKEQKVLISAEIQQTHEKLPPNSNLIHVIVHMKNKTRYMSRYHKTTLMAQKIKLEGGGNSILIIWQVELS